MYSRGLAAASCCEATDLLGLGSSSTNDWAIATNTADLIGVQCWPNPGQANATDGGGALPQYCTAGGEADSLTVAP